MSLLRRASFLKVFGEISLGLLWREIEVSSLLISMESVITWIYEKQLFEGIARGVS